MNALERLTQIAEHLDDERVLTSWVMQQALQCPARSTMLSPFEWSVANAGTVYATRTLDRLTVLRDRPLPETVIEVLADAVCAGRAGEGFGPDEWLTAQSPALRAQTAGRAMERATHITQAAETVGAEVLNANAAYSGRIGNIRLRSTGNVLIRELDGGAVGLLAIDTGDPDVLELPVRARHAVLTAHTAGVPLGFAVVGWPAWSVAGRLEIDDDVLSHAVGDIARVLTSDMDERAAGPWCRWCPESTTCPANTNGDEQ